MRIFWMLLLKNDNSQLIKNIKLDSSDHTSSQVKSLIIREFNLDYDTNIRLRNTSGSLVPINQYLDMNTKKTPYIVETYKIRKAGPRRQPSVPDRPATMRPVTHRPDDRYSTAYALKEFTSKYDNRLNYIEDQISSSCRVQKRIFRSKLDELEKQIVFIEKRIKAFQDFDWDGFFSRPVLW